MQSNNIELNKNSNQILEQYLVANKVHGGKDIAKQRYCQVKILF